MLTRSLELAELGIHDSFSVVAYDMMMMMKDVMRISMK